MFYSDRQIPQWQQLWAKTNRDKTSQSSKDFRYHPLLYHMLDVAAVTGLLWDKCLIPQLRKRFECSLGTDVRTQIVFLSGAHDLGKASPGFQKKVPELLQNTGLPVSENDNNRPHGFVSAHILNEVLGNCPSSAVLAQSAGGHHGVFPRSIDLKMGQDTLGNNYWKMAQHKLLQEFAKTVGFETNQAAGSRSEIMDPAVVPILAGFICVVDWIGSNQDFFPCAAACGSPVENTAAKYWPNAQEQAQKALEELGWLPAVVFIDETRFDTIFNGFVPNALQVAAIEAVSKQASPYLMIVEAPMGQGKTEAALYAADLAMCRGFARGMYIAMPTQATGNAMFKRVLDDYLIKRGHTGKLNLQLVHGDALLAQMADMKQGEIPEFNPKDIEDESDGDVEAQSWFTARKRPLLAPFGVGTIDQSLLSVLQTKHWFVRLFGLAGKVVIFDEVHAYDAYMSTILERLLHWLAEVDCTVILLSATLPDAKRKALAEAYSGHNDVQYKRYPRITLAKPLHYLDAQTNRSPICDEIPIEEQHSIDVCFAKTDLTVLTATLSQQLEHGGCAAVICNTVNRSIEVYKYLRDNLKDTECSLFHARTLQMWRREREDEVLRKFGKGEKQADGTYKNSHRPTRAVLVATQVIEQSLDLDFDLMVSEIAPVDLLLQRIGRLHRHSRLRPVGLETPQFIVLCDAETDGPPPESFGKNIEFVYDRYILLRTWMTMCKREKLEVPAEIEALVEAVYRRDCDGVDNDWSSALKEALAGFEVATDDSIGHARHLVVRQPDDPAELIERFNRELEDDDDPATDKKVRAATREGEPSIKVVFLNNGEKLPKTVIAEEVRWLLDRSASISNKSLFSKLLALKVPAAWQSNAHLRHCRLVKVGKTKGINVTVTQELGVDIQ
ncbi:MAG: CRISPR-associated helicase Cas3' [Nitrospirae bacterium]|nr:CRISPR-associated helicase Cas3' [Nitrospirota bacterium]